MPTKSRRSGKVQGRDTGYMESPTSYFKEGTMRRRERRSIKTGVGGILAALGGSRGEVGKSATGQGVGEREGNGYIGKGRGGPVGQ